VARIKYFISGALQYSQTFQYDPVNRLRYAVEHNNGVNNDAARAWYQTFDYDHHGNRGINVANTSDNADAANSALRLADFSGANNRITHADFVYDAAGNLIAEPGKSYTYDAQNRIVTAIVAGGGTSQYVYDGNGRRVKKIVGGVATRFEYGAGGELITERNDSNSNVIKDYFYKGGALIATSKVGNSGEYEYATADHLGSPRAWTGSDGNLIVGGRHDYAPFGEELSAGTGIRSASLDYGDDAVRQKFTSKERDSETGLDYFLARYYASIQGRFTSPDEFQGGPRELFILGSGSPTKQALPYADITNPQSLNKYVYAYNNPLRYIDPDGHIPDPDIAVIENGPTEGNPIGHTAIAVTGYGVFSFGNGTELGSSLIDYVNREATRRTTTIYIIKTTPEQDKAAVEALLKQDAKGGIGKYPDNCSARSNCGLDAAGVPQAPREMDPAGSTGKPPEDRSMPGTAGKRATGMPKDKVDVITVPKGSKTIPVDKLRQFEPTKPHRDPRLPKRENKKPQDPNSSS
jgi:RHS repeat-associated protein